MAELGAQGIWKTQNSRVSMEDAGRSGYDLHRDQLGKVGIPQKALPRIV